jgi:hypothetical protein
LCFGVIICLFVFFDLIHFVFDIDFLPGAFDKRADDLLPRGNNPKERSLGEDGLGEAAVVYQIDDHLGVGMLEDLVHHQTRTFNDCRRWVIGELNPTNQDPSEACIMPSKGDV